MSLTTSSVHVACVAGLTVYVMVSLILFCSSESSEAEVSHGGPVKSKHREDEDDTNAETHEAKRLKFDDENDEDEIENRQEEEEESPCSTATESSPDVPQSSSDVTAEVKDNKQDEFSAEDQGMCLIYRNLTLHCWLIYKVRSAGLL